MKNAKGIKLRIYVYAPGAPEIRFDFASSLHEQVVVHDSIR